MMALARAGQCRRCQFLADDHAMMTQARPGRFRAESARPGPIRPETPGREPASEAATMARARAGQCCRCGRLLADDRDRHGDSGS
jgi:hypothetical protein